MNVALIYYAHGRAKGREILLSKAEHRHPACSMPSRSWTCNPPPAKIPHMARADLPRAAVSVRCGSALPPTGAASSREPPGGEKFGMVDP
jgi:hypothetical protein